MKRGIIFFAAAILLLILICLIACVCYRCGVSSAKRHHTERDTITIVDTVLYEEPAANDSVHVKYITRHLPTAKRDTFLPENYAQNNVENIPPQEMSDERDSMAVEIPITQKRYEGAGYRAYVSGYEPNLDSIFVFPKTTTIRERAYKPPNKWHIGITAGYGYGFSSKHAEPYIGVGITYSIISF